MSGRQAWLRDPERERSFSVVDPLPHESAILEHGADMMMDMVRRQVAGEVAMLQQDNGPDDPFVDDEPEDGDVVLSPYQMSALAEDLVNSQEELPPPVPAPENEVVEDSPSSSSQGNEAT